MAERDTEPRVLLVHQQRGRVRAEPEERAVPDRHLAVVAGEQVEAHRRDPDVQRLRQQGRCRWSRSASGRYQPKNAITTAAATTIEHRTDARAATASSHSLHARGAEQPAGRTSSTSRINPNGTSRSMPCSACDVADRERVGDADDQAADHCAERRCRSRRARRPRTRTRGSAASTTARARRWSARRARPRARRPRRRDPSRASACARPGCRAAGSTRGCPRRRGTRDRASCAGAAGTAAAHSTASTATSTSVSDEISTLPGRQVWCG